jgi:hypothetical protein
VRELGARQVVGSAVVLGDGQIRRQRIRIVARHSSKASLTS